MRCVTRGAPILFVKKDYSIRLCIDYKILNQEKLFVDQA